MKPTSLLAAVLALGTLSAQSNTSTLDARIQLFAEGAKPSAFIFDLSNHKDQADTQWGGGVRFMGELASAPGWYYELGGKFDSSSKLKWRGGTSPTYFADNTDVKVTDSYWSLGLAYMVMKSNFTFGFHLEARGEALSLQGKVYKKDTTVGDTVPVLLGYADASTTYVRPWGRVSLDYNWRMGGMNPYVGVDASLAFLKTDQTTVAGPHQVDSRTLRSIAPRGSFAVYGGLRF